jgi:hypothetical protein
VTGYPSADHTDESEDPKQKSEQMTWRKTIGRVLNSSDFWTATSTIVIAVFTVELYFVSNRQGADSEAIQRAFVFSRGVNLYKPDPGASPDLEMVVIPIENTGTTAATDLEITANMFTKPSSEKWPVPFDFPDAQPSRPGQNPQPRALGPKETTIASISSLEQGCLSLIARNQLQMLVWGRIRYKDVFGARHKTNFCWQYVGRGLDYPLGTTPTTLFFPCPWHNCTDDDCKGWPDNRRAQYYAGPCRQLSSPGATPSPVEASPQPTQ